jgi:hypothetical protein
VDLSVQEGGSVTLALAAATDGVPFELLLLGGGSLGLGVALFVLPAAKSVAGVVLIGAVIAAGMAVGTGAFALADRADTRPGHFVVSYGSPREGRGMHLVQPAQEETPAEAEPGIWDLPWGDFAVALVIAALIGAVGGFVYAGIMGPRRSDEQGPEEEEE